MRRRDDRAAQDPSGAVRGALRGGLREHRGRVLPRTGGERLPPGRAERHRADRAVSAACAAAAVHPQRYGAGLGRAAEASGGHPAGGRLRCGTVSGRQRLFPAGRRRGGNAGLSCRAAAAADRGRADRDRAGRRAAYAQLLPADLYRSAAALRRAGAGRRRLFPFARRQRCAHAIL